MAAHRQLAPAGAVAIRLCRYNGLDSLPRLALARSVLETSSPVVAELVREFDALPSFAPGSGLSCPADDGSRIVALLGYPAGQRVAIVVAPLGCAPVTNGLITRTAFGYGSPRQFGPQLLAQLQRLTG